MAERFVPAAILLTALLAAGCGRDTTGTQTFRIAVVPNGITPQNLDLAETQIWLYPPVDRYLK